MEYVRLIQCGTQEGALCYLENNDMNIKCCLIKYRELGSVVYSQTFLRNTIL